MKSQLTRTEAIDAIRGKLLTLVDDAHSMCEAATRLGIFCGGFTQYTTRDLRSRYGWIVKNRPWMKRAELEDAANRWQLARQYILGTPLACDTQSRKCEMHPTCEGWRGFSDEKLEAFHRDLLGSEIEIVEDPAPAGA
jgi:hypothetical protein